MDPASRLRLRRRRRFIRAKTPAVKNRAHARLNPLAQMRDDELTFDQACTTTSTCPSRRRSKSAIVRRSPTAQRRWFCARNISSKKCNRAGPCGSSALRTRRIICRSSERRREKKFQTAKICESSVRKIVSSNETEPSTTNRTNLCPFTNTSAASAIKNLAKC